ncbi:MAG TPA: hypothetical protein DGG94_15505 [Micromonosporaceae bacterium]|nr:hypothetical protein [Micromonosporaceae bacterium]HCU51177.1 hypothetical protein [Micromonosporaceae bacterium]
MSQLKVVTNGSGLHGTIIYPLAGMSKSISLEIETPEEFKWSVATETERGWTTKTMPSTRNPCWAPA